MVTGRIDAARRMGDYVLHLIAAQPDFDTRFYPCCDTRKGLLTEGLPDGVSTYLDTFERQAPGQHYWLLGLLMAFLSNLYLATYDKVYMDSATALFEFGAGCHADLYSNTLNHKYLWGCARLYHATGDPLYLETALRIADFLVRIQEPEGTWWHSGFIQVRDHQTMGVTTEVTSQFCIWLVKLLQVM